MTIDDLFKDQLEKSIPLTEETIKELKSYKPEEGINTWKFGDPLQGAKVLYFMNKTFDHAKSGWIELELLESTENKVDEDFPEIILSLHLISSDNIYKLRQYLPTAYIMNSIPVFENVQF